MSLVECIPEALRPRALLSRSYGVRVRKRLFLLALQKLQEGLRRRRKQLLPAMDDSNGTNEFGHIRFNSGQRAGFNFTQHARLWKDAHARLQGDRMFDGLDVVEFHRNVDVYTVLPQHLVDGLSDTEAPIERDEVFSLQITMGHLLSFCQWVQTMAYEDHGLGMPRHDRQRPVQRRKGKDAEIGFVVDDGFDDLVWMQVRQPDLRVRVSLRELLRINAHIVQADGINHRHADGAADKSPLGCDLGLRFFKVIQENHAGIKELLSFGCHHEGPFRPIDELGAELLLELANRLACSGLRNPVRGCTKRKASRPDHIAIQT